MLFLMKYLREVENEKLLFIMLLTFTTMAYADEGRYTMVKDDYGVYILDSETGKVKHC